MTVVDASAVVKVLIGDLDLGLALGTVERPVSAPYLIDSEVTHVLRRLVIGGELTPADGESALDGFRQLIIRRSPVTHLLGRMWQLRHNLSGYDASYVSLAESLDVPLLTADHRLARAPGLGCEVEVV